jgi:predicted nucleic-acid-binding protein
MIALDTNVLVRFLLADDEEQAGRAKALIERRATTSDPAYITNLVMAELFWLLHRGYKISRKDLCCLLDGVLTKSEFHFENTDAVLYAFEIYRSGRGDFADALLGRVARQYGCETTYTFDKRASSLEDFCEA